MIPTAPDELLSAIAQHDRETVERILREAPEVAGHRTPEGASLVLHSCYVRAQELAPLLLAGRPPEATEAAALGDAAALRNAIENDDDARVLRSSDGWTPLHLAAYFGHVEAVALLIDHGAPLDALSTNAIRNTPLHAAFAGANNATIVRRLIFAGADVDARGAGNITPLHLAASRGDDALCDLLISRGADPESKADDGSTPAALAERNGHFVLAQRLAMIEPPTDSPAS